MRKHLFISFYIVVFLILATTLIVLYGEGYRFGFQKGKPEFSQTGLLVTTSSPDGAQVFINNHLTTATNNTINLNPGTYDLKIFKDGYYPWKKTIKIEREVVTKAEALLFPTAPKLENITSTGVTKPIIDPSFTKIAYTVASQSARKNGIYILNMNGNSILTLQSISSQIADDTIDVFSQAELSWSPDGTQLIASISANQNLGVTTYLLDTNTLNQYPKDVTATIDSVYASWNKLKLEKETAEINTLNKTLRKFVLKNFAILAWSSDETKILYQASASAYIPPMIKPLIGTNSTQEDRNIKHSNIYIYDTKEDKNYYITSSLKDNKLTWLPDSKHLIYLHNNKIDLMDYDNTNQTTFYAGPFFKNFAIPWPNGSKLVILTNLGNGENIPNLYTISLQ